MCLSVCLCVFACMCQTLMVLLTFIRVAPIIGSVIGTAEYRPVFSVSVSDRVNT